MFWFVLIFIFIFGLTIGSFINALQYRIDTDLSVIKGRSICPSCKKQLAWYDNVPVISFIVLRGKCRQCRKPIAWHYPIVELLTGFTFVAVSWKILKTTGFLGLTNSIIVRESTTNRELIAVILGILCLFLVSSCLMLVALHDQKTTYVLSSYIYVAIVATIIYLLVTYTGNWGIKESYIYLLPNFFASLLAMAPFAILYFVSRGAWMGAGDIEVAVLLGLLLGWPNFLIGLYFAFVIGSIWGLIKVYLLKNAGMKSEIPFAPFLIAGTIFGFVFGEQLISLYVNIFLG